MYTRAKIFNLIQFLSELFVFSYIIYKFAPLYYYCYEENTILNIVSDNNDCFGISTVLLYNTSVG